MGPMLTMDSTHKILSCLKEGEEEIPAISSPPFFLL